MPTIKTERLNIKPTHKNCWSIYDQKDNQLIGKLFFKDQWFNILLKPQSLRLGVATEATYGLMKAINNDTYKAKTKLPHAQLFLKHMGFTKHNNHYQVTIENLTYPDIYQELNKALKINPSKLKSPRQKSTTQLVDTEHDCFDRPCKLHPQANQAWQHMKLAAKKGSINLQLVSGYRSMAYQASLITNKIATGQNLSDILSTNAAPGHSEHHTGCAIDITTDQYRPLHEEFEQSAAFAWLTTHASEFGFVMSYPKDNDQGIIYEPWHWCYQV